ncbi:MAG: hypothetical protein KAS84_00160 [Anaerolineales bacterium]|nr:hypothetical protein [Anaerolineales bacterium]
MKQFTKYLIAFLFICLLPSCQPGTELIAFETPQLLLIGIPSDHNNQDSDILLDCADSIGNTTLLLEKYLEPYPDPEIYNFLIWHGNPSYYTSLLKEKIITYDIRSEDIVLIISNQNRLSSLQLVDLRLIFSGQIQDWSELPESTLSGPISLYIYYQEHPVRQVFEDAFLDGMSTSTHALIIPSQSMAIKEVGKNKLGLSYIIKSKADTSTRLLPVSGTKIKSTLSVLVITQEEQATQISPLLECYLKRATR